MKFECLASSSAGNCYYIELEREGEYPPVKLLLEVGLPYMEIVKKATTQGIDISKVDAILITHGHSDHAKSANDFVKRRRNVYANAEITDKYNGKPINTLYSLNMKMVAYDTKVIPFEVEHDAPNSLGFIIETSKEKLLFVNDCKFFKVNISGIPFDYICIETNYDGQTLHFAYEEAKKNNDYPNIARYERLFDSHMSLSNCGKHLQRLNLNNCKGIFLMHLSDRHANENKFKAYIQKVTNIKNVFVCKKNGGLI